MHFMLLLVMPEVYYQFYERRTNAQLQQEVNSYKPATYSSPGVPVATVVTNPQVTNPQGTNPQGTYQYQQQPTPNYQPQQAPRAAPMPPQQVRAFFCVFYSHAHRSVHIRHTTLNDSATTNVTCAS